MSRSHRPTRKCGRSNKQKLSLDDRSSSLLAMTPHACTLSRRNAEQQSPTYSLIAMLFRFSVNCPDVHATTLPGGNLAWRYSSCAWAQNRALTRSTLACTFASAIARMARQLKHCPPEGEFEMTIELGNALLVTKGNVVLTPVTDNVNKRFM